jgi:hypothetical protein
MNRDQIHEIIDGTADKAPHHMDSGQLALLLQVMCIELRALRTVEVTA